MKKLGVGVRVRVVRFIDQPERRLAIPAPEMAGEGGVIVGSKPGWDPENDWELKMDNSPGLFSAKTEELLPEPDAGDVKVDEWAREMVKKLVYVEPVATTEERVLE